MKVFRYHRGGLAESLATTIEVEDLADMKKKIESYWYCRNIRIENRPIKDDRLPPEWNGISYYVIADFKDDCNCCIGMCNFYEE